MQWKRKIIILATTSATHIVLRATVSTAFHTRYYSLPYYYYSFLTTTTRKFNTNQSRNLIFLELSSRNRRNYSDTKPINMPSGVKKENLPSKICVTCNRPFTWRKKWERVWDEVTTCSKSCNRKRRIANRQQQKGKEEDKDYVANSNGFLSSVDMESEDESIIPIEYPQIPELRNMKITDENSSGNEDDNSVHSEEGVKLVEDPTICDDDDDPALLAKKQRKALKKAKKAERRAQREGRGDPKAGQKKCDMCGKSVNLLIRCMYEEGQVDWKMVCGKCWNVASGGVVDGDSDHPHYKYGGLWKNRRAQT